MCMTNQITLSFLLLTVIFACIFFVCYVLFVFVLFFVDLTLYCAILCSNILTVAEAHKKHVLHI